MKSFRSWVGVARDQGWSSALIVFGNSNLVSEYCRQLLLLRAGVDGMGNRSGMPTIVGELGIPFYMNDGDAYRTGDFGLQISAMDTTLCALDMALLSGVLWNYTPGARKNTVKIILSIFAVNPCFCTGQHYNTRLWYIHIHIHIYMWLCAEYFRCP